MGTDRVVTKVERLAALFVKRWNGQETLNDRLELEGLVQRCDRETLMKATTLAQAMREYPSPAAALDRFAA